jgi:Undecaprenyl-phosphate galactose phosphotransferase WbaP
MKNPALLLAQIPKENLFLMNARVWMSIILAFSDTVALLFAFLIAEYIRLGDFDNLNRLFYVNFLCIPILLLLGIFSNSRLYPGIGISATEELRRLSISTSLLFLIVIALTFLLKTTAIFSRLVFFMAWLIALFLIPLARHLIRWICIHLRIWGEPVGVAGFPDRRVAEIANFFTRFPQKGLLPKAIFVNEPDRLESGDYQIFSDQPVPASFHQTLKTVLVVVSDWNWVGDNIDRYRDVFERVVLIRPQRDNFSLSDSIALDFNGVMGFQVQQNLLNPWSMAFKRLIDIAISSLCLLIGTPFAVIIYLFIHFDSPGGIFYRQPRLGYGGKTFRLLKFRTMQTNGDEIFSERLKTDKAFRDEWKKYQKIKIDPRITRVGSFLRKYSFDELPQLWNILKGEMSIVGPRPIMLNQKEMYGLDFKNYARVRPGVTGLWQISGRNHTTFARRTEFDMEYIQRWSVWLDIYIIFQTFKEVFARNGAY